MPSDLMKRVIARAVQNAKEQRGMSSDVAEAELSALIFEVAQISAAHQVKEQPNGTYVLDLMYAGLLFEKGFL